MPVPLVRIVLKDVPDPRGADKPPLFRRGQKVTSKKRPRKLPADHCTPRIYCATAELYLIDSFDAVGYRHFTLIRVGKPDDTSPYFPRNDLDVYGPELGDERCKAIVLRRKPDHSGLFVQA